jgi:hypothetical protein
MLSFQSTKILYMCVFERARETHRVLLLKSDDSKQLDGMRGILGQWVVTWGTSFFVPGVLVSDSQGLSRSRSIGNTLFCFNFNYEWTVRSFWSLLSKPVS